MNNRGVFFRAAAPLLALVTPPRQEISQYTVQPGDTVYGIAYKFGLSPETVLWSNPDLENNPHLLQVGQTLNILPFDGIYHQVGGGDTLDSIAAEYKVTPDVIINSPMNKIDPLNPVIERGQWVVVPGGSKPFIPPKIQSVVNYGTSKPPAGAPVGSGFMIWPVTGHISQGYYSYHPALDIESPIGTPVLAVDDGFVAAAGWDNSGYGWNVVIDHGNGLQSMYAHLQSYNVSPGDIIQKGQVIGNIGMSGRSSGPHLHIEIRQGTIQLNPANYLP
jgi:murein DD-endopeptidase MepM/ murein hydrolase activator NlpD